MTIVLIDNCPGRLAAYSMLRKDGRSVFGFIVWPDIDKSPQVTGIPDDLVQLESEVWTEYHHQCERGDVK